MVRRESIISGAILSLIAYTLALSLVSQAFPASQATAQLSSSGTIEIQTSVGIGVYSDYACNNQLNSVPWGTLEPGASESITCYIRNEGNVDITLQLEATDWSPTSASSYLTLDWNYNNQPVDVDQVVMVTLTLYVDSNIQGITNFSFTINIIGAE